MPIFDDTRADWNARPPLRPRTRVPWSERIGCSWHWIGPGKGPSAAGSHQKCLDQVREWQRQHQAKNWKDVGYPALVCQHARAIEGRGLEYEGSHSPGVNWEHVAIQFMVGEDTPGGVTPAMFARAQRLRADIGRLCPNIRRDWGHRDDPKASTACPGNAIHAWVKSGGPTAGAATPRTILRPGDRGDDVTALQRLLIAAGATIAADGSYGPATEAAVRAIQTARGLDVDGVAGPLTLAALKAPAPPAPLDPEVDDMTRDELKAAIREVLKEEGTARAIWTSHPIVKDVRGDAPDTDPRVTPSTLLEAAVTQTKDVTP